MNRFVAQLDEETFSVARVDAVDAVHVRGRNVATHMRSGHFFVYGFTSKAEAMHHATEICRSLMATEKSTNVIGSALPDGFELNED